MSKSCSCCKEKCCKCTKFNCISVCGDSCFAQNVTIQGTLKVTTLDVTGSTLNLCNTNVFVTQISACTPGGTIVINGTISISGSINTTSIAVCNISSCNGSTINFNNEAVFNQGIAVNTISSISGPVTFTSPVSLCPNSLTVGTITGCSGNPVNITTGVTTPEVTTNVINMTGSGTVNGNVTFTGAVTFANAPITSCSGVITNNIAACSGPVNVNSPAVFASNVSICSGTLFVATITGCNGIVNITSPTTVVSLTATNGVFTNTITPITGTNVTVNGSVTASGVNTCGGPLTVSQINPCVSGIITVGGNVIFSGTVTVTTLAVTTLTNPVSITLLTPTVVVSNNLQVCSGTLFVNTVSPCPGSSTVTFTSSITTPLVNTTTISSPTGTVTVNSNLAVTGTTTSCNGVITNSLTACSGPGIVVGSNLIIPNPNTLEVDTISANGSGTVTVTSPTVFTNTVTICNQPLFVGTINSCVPGVPVVINPGITTPTVITNNIFPQTGTTVTVNGNLTVTGTISGNIPNTFCTNGIQVNVINPCPGLTAIPYNATIIVPTVDTTTINGTGPGGSLTVNGVTTFNNTVTFNQPILVTTISPVGSVITVTGQINGCGAIWNMSFIVACAGGLTIQGPVSFTGPSPVSICDAPLLVNTIQSCTTNPIVSNSSISIIPGMSLITNSIVSTTGLTVTTPLATFTGNVSVCSGTLSVLNLQGCAGNPIEVLSNVNLCPNNSTLFTNNIEACAPTGTITLTAGNVNTTGNLNVCSGILSVATLSGCNGNPINVISPISFCPGGIITQIINPCGPGDIIINATIAPQAIDIYPGNTVINLLANTSLCTNNSILFTNFVEACTPTGTLTLTAGTVNTTGNVNVCAGTLSVANLQGCAGNPVNILSNISLCTNNSTLFTNFIETCVLNGHLTLNAGLITATGDLTVCSGNFSVETMTGCAGNPIVVNSNITMCPNNTTLFTNNIEACTPTGTLTLTGNVSICGGTLSVADIQGCAGNTIGVLNNVSMCPNNSILFVNTVEACSGTLTLNATNTIATGNVSVCAGVLFASQIAECPGSTAINVLNNVSLCTNNSILFVNTVEACSGTLTLNATNTIATGNVSVCAGTLSVATLSGCAGNPINVVSPIDFCTSGITTQVINPCGAGDIIINATIAPQAIDVYPGNTSINMLGNVNLCPNNSTLFTNTIETCTVGGTLTLNAGNTVATGNLSVCAGQLMVSNIITCVPGTPINVLSRLDVCTLPLDVNTITDCGGGVVTFNSNLYNPPAFSIFTNSIQDTSTQPGGVADITITTALATFTGNVTVCGGTLTVATIAGCGGAPINFCNSGITVQTINACNPAADIVINGVIAPHGIDLHAGDTAIRLLANTSLCPNNSILFTNTIDPCTVGGPVTVNGEVVATGFNLTNVNDTGVGTSILGPLVGPGGITRSFQTLTSTGGTVAITSNGLSVNLETTNTGTVTTGTNVGTGQGVFDLTNSTPTTLAFYSLASLNPALTIALSGQTINFNYMESNTIGDFLYNDPVSVPPNTWTDIGPPVQINATPGYTIVGNDITSIYNENIIMIHIDPNINGGANSLVSIGATYMWLRVLNPASIPTLRSHFAVPVFADPSSTFQQATFCRVEFAENLVNINDFKLQVWQNGTAPYIGGFNGQNEARFYPFG